MKSLPLALPLLLVAASAGCTIPGIGTFNFPWGPNTISLENDIVVIKSLSAIPDTVTAPQQIRLIAAIENRGGKAVPLPTPGGTSTVTGKPIEVELFDHCEGLFKTVTIDQCPRSTGPLRCDIPNLLPKEVKEVTWLLVPDESTKLITPCELKVSVTYPYTTAGLTTVHFINSQEYADRLARGTLQTQTSTSSLGEGPVKAWFDIQDKQPIVAARSGTTPSYSPVAFRVQNKGVGFVKDAKVVLQDTNIFSAFQARPDRCPDLQPLPKDIALIQEARQLPCEIQQPDDSAVPKELTRQLTLDISYLYEFREEVKVTVQPAKR